MDEAFWAQGSPPGPSAPCPNLPWDFSEVLVAVLSDETMTCSKFVSNQSDAKRITEIKNNATTERRDETLSSHLTIADTPMLIFEVHPDLFIALTASCVVHFWMRHPSWRST